MPGMTMDSDGSGELEYDGAPFFRVYKDGRVERLLGTDVVPPSSDPATGVASKDVVLDPATGVWVRLYLPPLPADGDEGKLPVLVYFHGGGFSIGSASTTAYHNYVNSVVARARVVAVSVDYRRVPEHPLPAAYDDSWAALQWVACHAAADGGAPVEPWLAEHGDFNRVFLAGDSAGGNIAHNMAMRAGGVGPGLGVEIEGIVLTHPFFCIGPPPAEGRARLEESWRRFLYPSAARGLEDPCVNPAAEGAPSLAGLGCRRVLVCLAERDVVREGGLRYYEALRGSGFAGEVELLESAGEEHVFHLVTPHCDRAVEKMERIVAFFHKSS